MKRQFILNNLLFNVIFASNSAFADNFDVFLTNLKTCQPYTGTFKTEFFGQNIQVIKKIYGKQNNSCFYTETVNGAEMECHLPGNLLIPLSNYYRISSKGESFSTQINANGTSKSYIDGKQVDNVLQYAYDKGYCKDK